MKMEIVPREETTEGRIESGTYRLNDINSFVSTKRLFDIMSRAGKLADTYWVMTGR